MSELLFPRWRIDAQEYRAVLRVPASHAGHAPLRPSLPVSRRGTLTLPTFRWLFPLLGRTTAHWVQDRPPRPSDEVVPSRPSTAARPEWCDRAARMRPTGISGARSRATWLAGPVRRVRVGTRFRRQSRHQPTLAGLAMGRLCGRRTVSRRRRPRRKARPDHRREPRPRTRSHAGCLEGGAEVIGIVRNRESREALQAQLPAQARATLLVADLSIPGRSPPRCRKRRSLRTP